MILTVLMAAFPFLSVAEVVEDVLRVPGATAYIEPLNRRVRVRQRGVSEWSSAEDKVVWYGKLQVAGKCSIKVLASAPVGERREYSLAVSAVGAATPLNTCGATATGEEAVDFGDFSIPSPGFYRFELSGIRRTGATFGLIQALELSGPPAKNAQFNLTERRNAASVHLWYPTPQDAEIRWFYNEVTVRTEPLFSYYMACGFHRGYFGVQVNSPSERRIIFSVWDSGDEAVDRDKVNPDDRVQLIAKGEGVVAHGFGNEGTGGHSHLVYPWKRDVTYRFLVSAEPAGSHTVFAGYFFFPERNSWGLIASFKAPKDGGYLRGLYSFDENFVGSNGQEKRVAEFGNPWVQLSNGQWRELTEAKFTHDGHGRQHRRDYEAVVRDGRFVLQTGGFEAGRIRYGDTLKRPANQRPPEIELEGPGITPNRDGPKPAQGAVQRDPG